MKKTQDLEEDFKITDDALNKLRKEYSDMKSKAGIKYY